MIKTFQKCTMWSIKIEEIIEQYTVLMLLNLWDTQYCMSKKSWPIWYCNLLHKLCQDFLDLQYVFVFRFLSSLRDFFNVTKPLRNLVRLFLSVSLFFCIFSGKFTLLRMFLLSLNCFIKNKFPMNYRDLENKKITSSAWAYLGVRFMGGGGGGKLTKFLGGRQKKAKKCI